MQHLRSFLTLLLLLSITISSISAITSEQIHHLTTYKKSLNNSIEDFVKCLKGNKDCDPQKTKILRAILAIIGIMSIGTIGGTIVYLHRKKVPKLSEDLESYLSSGNLPIVKNLITPETINSRDQYGNTPLHIAITGHERSTGQNNIPVINYLIEQGADINARNSNGQTPLLMPFINSEIAKTLIDNGADLNAQDKQGNSLLMNKASFGYGADFIQYLIAHGADTALTNKKHQTALDVAREAFQQEYEKALIKQSVQARYQPIINILKKAEQ